MIEVAERQLLLPPMVSSSGLFQRNLENDTLFLDDLTLPFQGFVAGLTVNCLDFHAKLLNKPGSSLVQWQRE